MTDHGRQLGEAIQTSLENKPTAQEILEWIADRESDHYKEIFHRTVINGCTDPVEVRALAVARRAINLMHLIVQYEEDVQTLFRAKAHMKRRGK